MATDLTIPAQNGPGLYYASAQQLSGTATVTAIDRQAVEDPRERALCRALLLHALAELDRTEPTREAAAVMQQTAIDERVRAIIRAELVKPQMVTRSAR